MSILIEWTVLILSTITTDTLHQQLTVQGVHVYRVVVTHDNELCSIAQYSFLTMSTSITHLGELRHSIGMAYFIIIPKIGEDMFDIILADI